MMQRFRHDVGIHIMESNNPLTTRDLKAVDIHVITGIAFLTELSKRVSCVVAMYKL